MRTKGMLALVAFLLPASAALASPFQWPMVEGGNGHHYEMIPASGMTWQEARVVAESMEHLGVQGHLATLTTEAELVFVLSLSERPTFGAYLGAWQKLAGDLDPGESYGWRWMTGEAWDSVLPQWCPWIDCNTGTYLSVTRMAYEGVVYYWEGLVGDEAMEHFVVEFDGMPVVDPPEGAVGNESSSWGSVKQRYRSP